MVIYFILFIGVFIFLYWFGSYGLYIGSGDGVFGVGGYLLGFVCFIFLVVYFVLLNVELVVVFYILDIFLIIGFV